MAETTPRIKTFFEQVKSDAKRQFERNGQLRMAMCWMLLDNNDIKLIPINMSGDKDLISTILRGAAQTFKPIALSFVSECWVAKREFVKGESVNETVERYKNMKVSEQPDKTEALFQINETRVSSENITIPIKRDSKGRPVLCDEYSIKSSIGGRFCHLLYDSTKQN